MKVQHSSFFQALENPEETLFMTPDFLKWGEGQLGTLEVQRTGLSCNVEKYDWKQSLESEYVYYVEKK